MGLFDFLKKKTPSETTIATPSPEVSPTSDPTPKRHAPYPLYEPPTLPPPTGHARALPICGERQFSISDYVVVDIETTGLSTSTDSIIEIGAVKIKDGSIIERFETFVNPQRPLPSRITELTGIADTDLAGAPDVSVCIRQLLEFSHGLPFVAHNAKFDLGFIVSALRRSGSDARLEYIDTLSMSKIAYPDFPSHRLEYLTRELGITSESQQHRALSDVLLTNSLYLLCRQKAAEIEAEHARFSEWDKEELDSEKNYRTNQRAIKCEEKGEIEKAINLYESIVANRTHLMYPYGRLAILYRKQKRYEDEIRICNSALDILSECPYPSKDISNFQHRKEVAEEKLRKLIGGNYDNPKVQG